jgi:hypothetical protein
MKQGRSLCSEASRKTWNKKQQLLFTQKIKAKKRKEKAKKEKEREREPLDEEEDISLFPLFTLLLYLLSFHKDVDC